MQGGSGKLNISAGKWRVTCEGDTDLEQPGDGQKAKEMADVRDAQRKDTRVLFD